jgi:hypothetical protein
LSQSWKKPVVCIFRERSVNPERDPFVVVRAKELTLTSGSDPKITGTLTDFFTLMGDTDYLTTPEGKTDHYVVCWFDDDEPDMTKDMRRLRGVRFNGQVTYTENEKTHKRTYNAKFSAEQGNVKLS